MNLLNRLLGRNSDAGGNHAATPSHGVTPKNSEPRLQALFARLSTADPADAARQLVSAMPGLLTGIREAQRRLALLDTLRAEAEQLLPEIERDIESASLPLAKVLAQNALAADNLLKALAREYQTVIAAISANNKKQDETALKRATLHAARMLVRRQWFACRAGKNESHAAWLRLHRLYRLARDSGFVNFGDGGDSIESYYLAAVLLALADPARSPRGEIVPLLATIRRLAPLAKLLDAAPPASERAHDNGRLLVVDETDPRPALGSQRSAASADAWWIDLDAAIERLQTDIRVAERRREDGDTDPTGVPLRVLTHLLESLRRQPVRRFSRQNMRPRVDMVTGFDRLWWALSGPSLSRRRLGGGLHGGLQQQDDEQEWIIVDESPDGFGLRLVRGQRPAIDVGDIVGVGMRDIGRLLLCIVRRIDDDPRMRCRIGVQQLSPEATAIVVYGQDALKQDMVIRLSSLPSHGGRPGIIAPAGILHAGKLAHEVEGENRRTVRVGREIESNGRHALNLIEPLP